MLNARRHLQRGLSLVELMVGITIGMIIAAGAAMVAVNQIGEHRRLMAETQMQQDLRTAADLIQQDLRRAGFRGAAQQGVWAPATPSGSSELPAQPNGYAEVRVTDGDTDYLVEYSYARSLPTGGYQGLDAPAANEQFGVRWNHRDRTLYLKLGLNAQGQPNWQPITDPESTPIVDFRVQPSTQTMLLDQFCDPCPVGATCTPPQLTLRQFSIIIRAQSHLDPRVFRTVTINERVRTDAQTGACP